MQDSHPENQVPDSLLGLIQSAENSPSPEEVMKALENLHQQAVVQGNHVTFPSLLSQLKLQTSNIEYEVCPENNIS